MTQWEAILEAPVPVEELAARQMAEKLEDMERLEKQYDVLEDKYLSVRFPTTMMEVRMDRVNERISGIYEEIKDLYKYL